MGRVFRAEDSNLNRQVALKVLPNKLKLDDEEVAVEQFIREARSAATLEHPNVVHIYEVNQTDKIWYIAMELLEGGNLRELIKANGPMDMIRACQVAAEAAEALDYAHKAGIVHRDVKPANLMLTRTGRCKLTDFGLARIDDANDSFHMGTESVGTPLYAAPEVTRGRAAQASADIYSLGCTLYYLLTGTPPFYAKTAPELMQLHQTAPPPHLCNDRPDLPETLAQAIIRAMAKEPEERFESAGQFAKVLRMHTIPVSGSGSGLGAGSGSAANFMQGSGSNPLAPAAAPQFSRRLLVGGSIAAVLVLAGGISAAVYFAARSEAPPMLAAPRVTVQPAADVQNSVPPPPPKADALQENLVPAATFQASETSRLMAIAKGDDPRLAGKPVSVVGQIATIHPTPSGKSMRIEFVGSDSDVFCATCPPSLAKLIQDGFTGRLIRITGVPLLHKDRAEIRIDSLDQIQAN